MKVCVLPLFSAPTREPVSLVDFCTAQVCVLLVSFSTDQSNVFGEMLASNESNRITTRLEQQQQPLFSAPTREPVSLADFCTAQVHFLYSVT